MNYQQQNKVIPIIAKQIDQQKYNMSFSNGKIDIEYQRKDIIKLQDSKFMSKKIKEFSNHWIKLPLNIIV